MRKLGRFFGSTIAAIYFIFCLFPILFLFLFMPLGFLMDVETVRNSGFAGPNVATALIGLSGLVIGLSILIPPLNRVYIALPWLGSFVKIFYINFIILNLAFSILNYGYETTNTARHTTFFVLMILFLIASRLAMSFYFKWKPATNDGVRQQ